MINVCCSGFSIGCLIVYVCWVCFVWLLLEASCGWYVRALGLLLPLVVLVFGLWLIVGVLGCCVCWLVGLVWVFVICGVE